MIGMIPAIAYSVPMVSSRPGQKIYKSTFPEYFLHLILKGEERREERVEGSRANEDLAIQLFPNTFYT